MQVSTIGGPTKRELNKAERKFKTCGTELRFDLHLCFARAYQHQTGYVLYIVLL